VRRQERETEADREEEEGCCQRVNVGT